MTVRKKHSQSLSFPYKAFVCPSQILIYKQLLASYNFSPAPNFWELFNFFMFCKHKKMWPNIGEENSDVENSRSEIWSGRI